MLPYEWPTRTDSVVHIKTALIQSLFGILSLRKAYRESNMNVAYFWFLCYSLLNKIPHFATVSYAFRKRFPPELAAKIFKHIFNWAGIKFAAMNLKIGKWKLEQLLFSQFYVFHLFCYANLFSLAA
ncbi:MAG: transposase [Clostridiales bacterium]|nr:transposase [Clostridiales bacterium]